MDNLSEVYLSVYQELDEAAVRVAPKARGSVDPQAQMAGRSDAGKRISGDAETGPRHYTLGRARGVVPDAPTKPGQRPVGTPKLAKWEKDDIQYRNANLKAGKVHKVGGPKGLPEEADQLDEITASMGRRAKKYRQDQEQAAHMERMRVHQERMENDPAYKKSHMDSLKTHQRGSQTQAESFDLFDYLLEYLVAEGYADTNAAAIKIMANMSEEWRESIVEEVLDEKKGERPRGLPYGPVGKKFRELTIPQRKAMLKRGSEHTRAAMRSGEEYSGSHAASSAIDSALRSRRLGGRG
jgi:hypothetical protein